MDESPVIEDRSSASRDGAGEERRAKSEDEEAERKERLLTKGRASVTRSISSAIVTKDGNLFLVTETNGGIPTDTEHGFGLYYNDCRYLSGYEIAIGGARADSLAATAEEGFRARHELTNADIRLQDQTLVPKETLGIRFDRLLDGERGCFQDRIQIENFGAERIELPVAVDLRATFEDVFSVRGLLAKQPGRLHEPLWQEGSLVFRYDGSDGVRRLLVVGFDPAPQSAQESSCAFALSLAGRGHASLTITMRLSEGEAATAQQLGPSGSRTGERKQAWIEENKRIESDSILLNRIAEASFRDLAILRTALRDETYFAAGVPWFVTLFGRDSLITAFQTLAFNTDIAASTLRLLASLQGTKVDDWRDEQPGKILHELRIGELARAGELPHTPYYGSVDATPLFLILLAAHAHWTGSLELFRSLIENVEAALAWIDRYGDSDGDGYIEYSSASEKGLINQGWKDSGDAIVTQDGDLAAPPIALVEVQGYVYAAKREMAVLFEKSGDSARAAALRGEAAALRERFNRDFWSESLGTFCLALQAGKKPAQVVTSNAGHTLWSGIAEPELARRTAERLMQEDMFSGWGIRTLSTKAKSYNPNAYHLGTVWPHDNALIAAGFRSYGFDDFALRIFESISNAASYYEHYRLPELFAGQSASTYGVPVRYPVACHPQAWAAGSVPFLLQSALGLKAEGFDKRLTIIEPVLPSFVDRLQLFDIRVGTGSVDLSFERTPSGAVATRVLARTGSIDVLVEPRLPRRASGTGS